MEFFCDNVQIKVRRLVVNVGETLVKKISYDNTETSKRSPFVLERIL